MYANSGAKPAVVIRQARTHQKQTFCKRSLIGHPFCRTEPVNVLSKYKHQDGLWYYESTRDVASHFFIDYLPKGVYVFEYSVRVQHRGQYQTGIAQIQCMYAPEFNSHSQSVDLDVQ